MADLPRFNGVIGALEQGSPLSSPLRRRDGVAQAINAAPYDGVVFEMEHGPTTSAPCATACNTCSTAGRSSLGQLAPAVTPFVRIPPNGGEMSQWIAKQVLDSGVYGMVWPHVSTVDEARNAVAACRYPRPARALLRAGRAARRRAGGRRALLGAQRSRNITRAPTSGR